jgi:hypothetical protein
MHMFAQVRARPRVSSHVFTICRENTKILTDEKEKTRLIQDHMTIDIEYCS